MIIFYNSIIAKLILPEKFSSIALCWLVFTKKDYLTFAQQKHEYIHTQQWKRYWYILFPFVYLYYHIKYGYQSNPFEVEARQGIDQ